MDIGVSAVAELACPLWLLGYPVQASRRTVESLSLALRVGHKFTIGYALFYSALREALDRRQRSRAHASKLLDIAQSEGFNLFCAAGEVFSGWSTALQGDIVVGIEGMRRGLAAWTSTGAEIFRPFYLYLLAEAYALTRDTRNGLAALDEAIVTIERTNERWVEAEVRRFHGELLLELRDDTENDAGAEFQHATPVARVQSAKLWELRASTSLARLRRDQGRHAEARDLLAPVYGWFTEGFDTPDLKQAKALLDEL
jgi:predicted ATPase